MTFVTYSESRTQNNAMELSEATVLRTGGGRRQQPPPLQVMIFVPVMVMIHGLVQRSHVSGVTTGNECIGKSQ